MSRAFWLSSPTLGDQYSCNTTGTAGCGAATLFHLIKVQDDDDGNLSNGTPHGNELQCAFGRHQTGCVTDPPCLNCYCPTPLGTPTVTVTPLCNGQNRLDWTAVTNAVSYRVFRGEEGCGGGFALVATIAAPVLTYTDSGLLGGRIYYYNVQALATSSSCDGPLSPCGVGPTPATGSPTGLTAAATDANACVASGITVAWTTPTWNDIGGVRTFTVLRNAVAIASGPCAGTLPETTTQCNDTTAVPGTAYNYTVKATNGCGSSATSSGTTATDQSDTTPPAIPGISLTKAYPNINFSWAPVPTAVSYSLYSAPAPLGPWTLRCTFPPYGCTIPDLPSPNNFFYTLTAVDSCGNQSP